MTIVICGAGVMGISAAYQLAVQHGLSNILILDELPPFTLTSDKSTECYRNWWPGPGDAMVQLMNRSISLMEEMAAQNNNIFKMNKRGYLYVSTDLTNVDALRRSAQEASALGAGELREHGLDSTTYSPAHPKTIPLFELKHSRCATRAPRRLAQRPNLWHVDVGASPLCRRAIPQRSRDCGQYKCRPCEIHTARRRRAN
jgi:glycine/D-amino acid oxidase-like deaminating enzyme